MGMWSLSSANPHFSGKGQQTPRLSGSNPIGVEPDGDPRIPDPYSQHIYPTLTCSLDWHVSHCL